MILFLSKKIMALLATFFVVFFLKICLAAVFDTGKSGQSIEKILRVGESQPVELPHDFNHITSIQIPDGTFEDIS
jgi:hypothetical protein